MDDWSRSHDTRAILLSQAGSLADDETLDDLRLMIYSERGRPEEELSEALEDYCLNRAMNEGRKTPLMNRDEALIYMKRR